ncbi:hypothetical protein RJ639_008063 [Escallonia herrerae]|uniref:Transposase-associated domain-containing protein n=1 Tax=Escallonia herrerae TaxID=1293975 RepID=A0AA88VZG0_9ASTE|nr:hypothetical protein RJ639_008063 [Escallonia herrerae]
MKEPNYMDKEWLNLPRASEAYHQGVNRFLDFAFRNVGTSSGEILCPCTRCVNGLFQKREIVEEHLVMRGFANHYRIWKDHGEVNHGEVQGEGNMLLNDVDNRDPIHEVEVDRMPELVNDVLRNQLQDDPCTKATKFEKYMNEANRELRQARGESLSWYLSCSRAHIVTFMCAMKVTTHQHERRLEDPLCAQMCGQEKLKSTWGYNNVGQMYTGAVKEMTAWLGTLARKHNIFPIYKPFFSDFSKDDLEVAWAEIMFLKDGKNRSQTEMYVVSRTCKDGTVLESTKEKLVSPSYVNESVQVSLTAFTSQVCLQSELLHL